jgi:GxxExxY protein
MEEEPPSRDPLTYRIIGCGIKVHQALGLALLESAYDECLRHELTKAGLEVTSKPSLPVEYDGLRLPRVFRPDLIVNGEVIVEIKTVVKLLPIHDSQLLTYMRLSEIERGLLMNFHARRLIDGVRRLILTRR